MRFPRSSGILLHPTSLPGRFGIGDLGAEAHRFADFLNASGLSLWQVLPLGPTGYGDSPYACYSAFAGNTLLISPERLIEAGLLTKDDLEEAPTFAETKVDFEGVHTFKDEVLRKAYHRFGSAHDSDLRSEFDAFCAKHGTWLEDYALFRALKDMHGGKPWHEWDAPYVRRDSNARAR